LSSIGYTAVKYVVDVYTGDVSYAGTDANVYLCMYGEKGVSKETKLVQSQYHTNKFERNNVRGAVPIIIIECYQDVLALAFDYSVYCCFSFDLNIDR
jgi:hypothetical protein